MAKAWKQHELVVAKYFGVERGKRGGDFGQELSCEVVAPLTAWSAASEAGEGLLPTDELYGGVVVECKQGYSSLPGELMRDAQKNNPNPDERTTLLSWGNFLFSWMEDRKGARAFERVWNEIICSQIDPNEVILNYYIAYTGRQVPKYLNDFYDQANLYVTKAQEDLKTRVRPLVALHAKGMRGRIIVARIP